MSNSIERKMMSYLNDSIRAGRPLWITLCLSLLLITAAQAQQPTLPALPTTCDYTSEPANISLTAQNVPSGYSTLYVLVNMTSGMIVQTNATILSFTSISGGLYYAVAAHYKGNLMNAQAGKLISDVYSSDLCLTYGATLALKVCGACDNALAPAGITITATNVPAGVTTTFALVDEATNLIVQTGATPSFTSVPVGDYTITSVHYTGSLTALAAGHSLYDVTTQNRIDGPENCLSVSNTIAVKVCSGTYDLSVRMLLQGALVRSSSPTLMDDQLRTGGYVPHTTPYSAAVSPRFAQVGGGGSETTTPTVLSTNAGTGNALVDWVLVELRDPTNPATIVATRSGLLQRDGDVVRPTDGTSPLSFTGLTNSTYYVSVKHRNHLGVMTATAQPLSTTGTLVDFTTMTPAQLYDKPGAVAYDGLEMVTINGKQALWAGDASADGKVKYSGSASDANQILNDVLGSQPGNPNPNYNYDFTYGYFYGDLDMNGKAKYQGTVNDALVIFSNVIAKYTLNTQQLYNYNLFIEQLP